MSKYFCRSHSYTPFTRYNRLSNRLYKSNRVYNWFDNRVERTATVRSTGCQLTTVLTTGCIVYIYKHLTGCQSGLTTGCIV